MKIILTHVTDKIHPDSSIYVGHLFTKEEMRRQEFSFNTVCTPSEYFSDPQHSLEEKIEEKTSSRTSPMRTGDMEYEQKDLDSSFFTRPDSTRHRPFDDLDTSQTSSQKRCLFPIPELQERQTSFYYSKIKDLNSMISCKLTSRFDKIKAKAEMDIGKGTPSPETKVSLADITPDSGKRKRDFEEDIFDVYASDAANKAKIDNDIFDSSENMKDNKEISNKLRNIRFEVVNESDAQPIIKKLKGPESVKVN